MQRFVIPVIANPDLGFNKHVIAIQAGSADGFSDGSFVAVGCGGIDVPVSDSQCFGHGFSGVVRRDLVHAKP